MLCLQLYGFCFGSKKATEAIADKLDIKAIAMIHPSFTDPKDAETLTVPVCLVPSKGEDMDVIDDFWNVVQKKPFASKCVRKDFVRTSLVERYSGFETLTT